LYRREARIL